MNVSATPLATMTAVLVLGVAGAPALAQLGNPGFMAPTTMVDPPGKPAATRTNVTDALFVQLIAAGDRAEVQAADLALKRSGGDAVKSFAEQMKKAHSDSSAKLASIADSANVPIAKAMPPDQQAKLKHLESLDAASFDAAYLRDQLVEHQKAVQLLTWEIGQGQNAALQQHAAAALVDVWAHMETIQRLLAEHSTVGAQGLATR